MVIKYTYTQSRDYSVYMTASDGELADEIQEFIFIIIESDNKIISKKFIKN